MSWSKWLATAAGSLVLLALSVGSGPAPRARSRVVDTAGVVDPATLEFHIRDGAGVHIPGRLTFLPMAAQPPGALPQPLFPRVDADPTRLSIRNNVIYAAAGHGIITVPPGSYRLQVSHGMEWSRFTANVELLSGKASIVEARLIRQVDSRGFIGGDFHLHTVTHSGHGDANVLERVISVIGEGLEFAVASDHNHSTDYRPELQAAGAQHLATVITGNEVSAPIGHINVFPLDPGNTLTGAGEVDAEKLFRLMRQQTNQAGIVPIIQVNHPRAIGHDYFGTTGLDPVTGLAPAGRYVADFDSVEVMNGNEGSGFYDASDPATIRNDSRHWVLADWFNQLNRGHRYAAVGNSDSHTVIAHLAGIPRTFVASSTDDPAQISPEDIVAGIRRRAVLATTGPFVRFWVNDTLMGGDTVATNGTVHLRIHVQAADWIAVDRVRIIVNGETRREIAVPDTRAAVRLDHQEDLSLANDAWIAVLADSDRPMASIVPDERSSIRPVAVANPVWVDVDGDGRFTTVAERMQTVAATAAFDDFRALSPTEKVFFLGAVSERNRLRGRNSHDLVRLTTHALSDPERRVRIAAAALAGRQRDRRLIRALEHAANDSGGDIYLKISCLRALAVLREQGLDAILVPLLRAHTPADIVHQAGDILAQAASQPIRAWQVSQYFPGQEPNALAIDHGPETSTVTARRPDAPRWEARSAGRTGYLDLSAPDDRDEHAVAYAQTFVHVTRPEALAFATGSNDGGRLYLNGEMILEDRTAHPADPMRHIGIMHFRRGWNRILYKVQNDRGAMGFFLKVFTPNLRVSSRPRPARG